MFAIISKTSDSIYILWFFSHVDNFLTWWLCMAFFDLADETFYQDMPTIIHLSVGNPSRFRHYYTIITMTGEIVYNNVGSTKSVDFTSMWRPRITTAARRPVDFTVYAFAQQPSESPHGIISNKYRPTAAAAAISIISYHSTPRRASQS